MIQDPDWLNAVQKEIQKGKFTRREYKLFAISRFEKSVKWVDQFSPHCPECNKMKADLLATAHEIENLTEPTGLKSQQFELVNDLAYQHLRKVHKLVPSSYYVALHSLLGMLIGALAGGLFGMFADFISDTLNDNGLRNGLLIGWFAGVVLGQISGKRKDNRLKKEGRQF
jgi:hypothetical protein